MIDDLELACFCGNSAGGNRHRVIYLDSEIFDHSLEELIPLAIQNANVVVVQARRKVSGESISSAPFNVRFFENKQEITRCGSGSLAAGYFIFKRLKNTSPLSLKTGVEDVVVGRIGHKYEDVYFYLAKPLGYVYPARHLYWSKIIGRVIQKVIYVGDNNGYCILVLNSLNDVKQCSVKVKHMMRFTSRALIVTAATGRIRKRNQGVVSSRIDYVMRYFIPQYGKYEDEATGSANLMLAAYWQKSLNKTKVVGYQLSNLGGEFSVQKSGAKQKVVGRIKELYF